MTQCTCALIDFLNCPACHKRVQKLRDGKKGCDWPNGNCECILGKDYWIWPCKNDLPMTPIQDILKRA